ncbi:hypothetical protein [Acidovorax sp.]|uniref:hypothetical protein n=1 Tax=Acidovorax sp. TaxID=1872122 RepID=UPI0026156141|nr:hypothetical protein [Acidovorax sp.]
MILETAMHPPAPHSAHHAALLVLVGMSPLHRRALPGTSIAALAGASNGGV